ASALARAKQKIAIPAVKSRSLEGVNRNVIFARLTLFPGLPNGERCVVPRMWYYILKYDRGLQGRQSD
ncbi:MAG: hypothetical protein NTX21_00260, partial [Alphaproteobacteria bacterium]|nr:hypothetical protein [Alphaproteobacteria bacterium]